MSASTVKPAAPTPVVGGLRRRWTTAFVAGELVGFVPPAITGTSATAAACYGTSTGGSAEPWRIAWSFRFRRLTSGLSGPTSSWGSRDSMTTVRAPTIRLDPTSRRRTRSRREGRKALHA